MCDNGLKYSSYSMFIKENEVMLASHEGYSLYSVYNWWTDTTKNVEIINYIFYIAFEIKYFKPSIKTLYILIK